MSLDNDTKAAIRARLREKFKQQIDDIFRQLQDAGAILSGIGVTSNDAANFTALAISVVQMSSGLLRGLLEKNGADTEQLEIHDIASEVMLELMEERCQKEFN